jgi:hypothetical protein
MNSGKKSLVFISICIFGNSWLLSSSLVMEVKWLFKSSIFTKSEKAICSWPFESVYWMGGSTLDDLVLNKSLSNFQYSLPIIYTCVLKAASHLKAVSHLSENRGTKGNKFGKWTECARIQRIKNKFDFKLSDHKLLSNMINKQ